jgi:hypothetical protein
MKRVIVYNPEKKGSSLLVVVIPLSLSAERHELSVNRGMQQVWLSRAKAADTGTFTVEEIRDQKVSPEDI